MLKRILAGMAVLALLLGILPMVPAVAGATPNYVYRPVITTSNASFTRGQLSANGRYVLYGLNNKVYVHDLNQGSTTQLNTPYTAKPAGISSDGRYVAYMMENPAILDVDGRRSLPRRQNFLIDRQTQQVQQLDIAHDGGLANASSNNEATISDDGQLVVFRSTATNLVANVSGQCEFYIRNLATQTNDCAAYTTTGESAGVMNAQLSGNGRYVAIELKQEVTNVGNGGYNLLVRDLQTNTYQNIRQAYTGQGEGLSISRDGRYVGFLDIYEGYSTWHTETIRYDTATNTQEYASISTNGLIGDGDSQLPRISADGQYMAYQSYRATNLLDGSPTNEFEVYLRDFAAGTTTRVANAANETVTNGWNNAPSISEGAQVITFESFATNLNPLQGTVPSGNWRGIYARTPQQVPPDIPTGLTATSPTNSAPQLSWSAVNGVNHYTIYRDGNLIGSSSTPSYMDTTATEGSYMYRITATNMNGIESGATSSIPVVLDVTAPSVGSPGWSANPIEQGLDSSINISVTDNLSGVTEGEYFLGADPGTGNAIAMTWDGTTLSATLGASLAPGTHSLNIRAKDAVNNWSTTITTDLVIEQPDMSPPSITPNLPAPDGQNGWYISPVNLSWTVEDLESPIAGQTGCDTITQTTDTTSASFTCSATSEGGISSQTVTIKYDTTAPLLGTPIWTANSLPVGNDTTFTISASDTTSGVVGGEYFLGTDPGTGNAIAMTWDGMNLHSGSFGAALTPGVYAIGIRAQDAAGTWSMTETVYLVVFDPAAPQQVTGQNRLAPVFGTDVLPGLIVADQKDKVDFGFDIRLLTNGQVDPTSQFSFNYETGKKCNSPNPENCHVTTFSASSFSWVVINGTNNSSGAVQGVGSLVIDGVTTTNAFKVVGLDADRLGSGLDQVTIYVYAPGADPNTAQPLYHVTGSPQGQGVAIQ